MDFNQAIVALGFKPITYPSRQIKKNKLQAGMRRIEEKLALFNKMILRGREPQEFVTGQWAQPQAEKVNRVKALEANLDVYLTPNHIKGNRRNETAVDGLYSFFIDIDAGKDENGNYLPLEVAAENKKEMMRQIKAMPKCTALNETRNGYHVYWAIKEDAKISQQDWDIIQTRIVEITGADPKVKNAAGLLRMPYTFWCKADKGNYDIFLARIVEVNEIDYDPRELIADFEAKAEEKSHNNITSLTVRRDTTVPTVGMDLQAEVMYGANDNIAAIKELDHQHFNSLFNPQPQRMIKKEAATYLKSKIDLAAFLGLPERFCCIFHDDKKPSAVIMPPRKNNTDWIYLCHSSNCSYAEPMNIINVVMAIAGVNFNKALEFLAAAFNIILPSGKRGRHIDQMITSNTTALHAIMIENKAYNKKLKRFMDVYDALTQIAKVTAEKTNTQYYGHDVYFAASTRFLAKQMDTTDEGQTHRKTVLLAALGLIEKVADADLPEAIKQRDYLYKRDLETYYGEDRTIQYYRLPAIDTLAAMRQIKKQLDRWIAGKGQIKNINENLITGIFGYDVAASIYAKKAQKNAANANQHSSENQIFA